VSLIEVPDTAAALMQLGSWARSQLPDRVVGITGSVGKTSTKDLLASALASSLRVTANRHSFNNEQGLPVTVLGAFDDTEVLVLEMGMRGFGEITRLCEVGRPTVGVVTSVGHSHTGRVGGIDGVAKAKAELIQALPPDGVAVLNADDVRVAAMRKFAPGQVVTFGAGSAADVVVVDLRLDELARPRFVAETPWGRHEVALASERRPHGRQRSGCAGRLRVLGVPLDGAARGARGATVSAMRMETSRTATGAVVINDAYNANPTSMRAALESMAAMGASGGWRCSVRWGSSTTPPVAIVRSRSLRPSWASRSSPSGTELYGVAPVDDPVAALGDRSAPATWCS
jgi:UDP-N-acetylmuramoyl-tripeptide--D-alanyl-D-alanine ligase